MDVREKLVELVGQVQDCGCDVTDVVKMNYVENEVLADRLIANGVTVQEWISVKDRLPERDVKVLTFGVYGFSVNYLDRFSGKWRGVNGRSQWITHWMPLPQPPKGE